MSKIVCAVRARVFIFLLAVSLSYSSIQAQSFALMRPDYIGFGIYGTQGTESAGNHPGDRASTQFAASDSSNCLWMFGGWGSAEVQGGMLNDLWRYNIGTNNWTWVKGSKLSNALGDYGTSGTEANGNCPGARNHGASWVSADGTLWLFGGWGYNNTNATGLLNDLWKYNPISNNWTWVTGTTELDDPGNYGTMGAENSNNLPPARDYPSAWIDASGNLWLFGGTNDSGAFNDLWRFRPSTGYWTWMGGSNLLNEAGSYGSIGIEDLNNKPGARYVSAACADTAGNLWLYAGYGYSSSGAVGRLNDLWKYNISSAKWTWISGGKETNETAEYGTQDIEAAENHPGARSSALTWTDSVNSLWMFGGIGVTASTEQDSCLNDLWKFVPSTGRWTWVKGSNTWDQVAVKGTVGVTASGNIPSSRVNTEQAGTYASQLRYLVGGTSFSEPVGEDVWKLDLDAVPVTLSALEFD